jgi:hypothetical protein
MAFSDPQSLTINAVSTDMPRVGSSEPERVGRFRTADGEYEFTVRQNQTSARYRREIRLTQKKVAADPISAVNKEVSASVILVVDEPKWGFSDTELGYLTDAIEAWFDSSSRAKMLGGEL